MSRTQRSARQYGIGVRHRAAAIGLALSITALMLFLLISFGPLRPAEKTNNPISVVSISASPSAEESVEDSQPEPAPSQQQPRETADVPPQPNMPTSPVPPIPVETPQPTMPTPPLPSTAPPISAPATPKIGVRIREGASAGPANRQSASAGESERVGNAPNGEPMYKAAWYREPTDGELAGYLSTANSTGWGLIACRTVADFRVEDCAAIDEYPAGSQINRAILAAAWQFRVRPPRVGGQPLVGSWVRIRIDYGQKRR